MDSGLRKRVEKAKTVALAYLASQGYEDCRIVSPVFPPSPATAPIRLIVWGRRRTPRGVLGKVESITMVVQQRGYQGLTQVPEIVKTKVVM